MASEHEALVEDLAREIWAHDECGGPPDNERQDNQRDKMWARLPDTRTDFSCGKNYFKRIAIASVAIIAERTKKATEAMCDGINSHAPEAIWTVMQQRSALYPHGTDGIEEKTK